MSLLHRAVAAADDEDLLVREEGAVACRASRDATPHQRGLCLQTQEPRARARRDDHSVSLECVEVCLQGEGARREVDLVDLLKANLCPEALGLRAELIHHLRAHDPLWISGVVLYIRRDRELTTGLEPLKEERLQVGACGVDGCGVTGGARADDDYVSDFAHGIIGACGEAQTSP